VVAVPTAATPSITGVTFPTFEPGVISATVAAIEKQRSFKYFVLFARFFNGAFATPFGPPKTGSVVSI
jgi:hypothetical protein